ncbi:MAG: hypothetical protein WA799_08970 [Nitrosotalea sp.]
MSLVKVEQEIDVGALKKRYDIIQQIKKEILTEDDFVTLSNGEKATRKSGWLKYAVAFALSFEVLSERKEVDPANPSRFAYHITVKCRDPTGTRSTEAVGSCTLLEKTTFSTEHIVRAMADTRATERAIIKMLGTNEKAAEDLPENMVVDSSIASNFCQDKTHKKDHDEKTNKCAECGKMVRFP